MSRLDLNLVRVLVAIYETRSVTQAATRLDVTQPTVSHSLSKLREVYKDHLFARGPNGLTPTALCDQLFAQLSEALANIESSLGQAQTFDLQTSTRRFRLAMSDIGVLFFAPPLLRRCQQVAPRVQIDIVQSSDAIVDELASCKLDLAVGNFPGLVASTCSLPLFREHYVCVMSMDHPTIGDNMTLQEFAAARHIMVASPASGHALVDGVLSQQGVTRNIVARVPQFTVLPQLLTQSDLVVIAPSRVARLFAAQGGLKALPLPMDIPGFEVRMHWHPRQESNWAHRWLRDEVVQTLSAL